MFLEQTVWAKRGHVSTEVHIQTKEVISAFVFFGGDGVLAMFDKISRTSTIQKPIL